ncbi:hypothetical protein DL96DRAFT_1684711 [Flagelloscypha sp. PMI_526]|nr:hypothetical protein DL96DRAFT_1684711 [Flagelloscypha sp. PMI_526]
MTSSSHSHLGGLGTPQAKLSRFPPPLNEEGPWSGTLAAVGKGAVYAIGGTVLSPVILSGAIFAAVYVLGHETILWSRAVSSGTLEDYRKKRKKRWALPSGGGGCGNAQAARRRRALERAAATEAPVDSELSGSSLKSLKVVLKGTAAIHSWSTDLDRCLVLTPKFKDLEHSKKRSLDFRTLLIKKALHFVFLQLSEKALSMLLALQARAIVVAIYILGRETVLWTIAASTGTLEDYRRKRRKRWTMGGGRCGTCRVNAERNAKKRAAAAETYRKEHGMNTK